MTEMHVYKICLTVLSLGLMGASVGGTEMSLPELLEHHTRACGGRQAIESVGSLEVELQIVEPTFEVSGLYRAERSGSMRIDIFDGSDRVFSEGLDGAASWQWKGGEQHAESTVPEAAAALRHGIVFNLLGLYELEPAGHRIEYLGLEELDGVKLHALEITLADGFIDFRYLDPDSYLVVRSRSFRAFHPDLDPTAKWHEVRYSDFREIGGQTRAFLQETIDLTTGDTISTVTTRAIRLNPELDAEVFQAP
jgi:hypothetical protein